MTDLFPMPDCMNLSRVDWIATPPVVREEIIRAWQELSAGIAVRKDRRCGREKSHKQYPAGNSFYALHLLDMEKWYRPNAKKIAEADALRERLAPDFERLRLLEERDAGLAPFHTLAEAGGTTLATALRGYVEMENMVRANPIKGLGMIASKAGIDFADLLARIAEGTPLEKEAV